MAYTDLRQPLLSIQQPLGVSLSQETQLDLFNLTDLQTEYSQQDTNFYPYNIQNTLAGTIICILFLSSFKFYLIIFYSIHIFSL